ncbi:hypothetical protein RRG08_017058 [Elysia crispata]|uniref:carbonic anhydrase n=1 Tax=Elysia crispata TaxID=231223 RepID=A0AAE0Z9L3_9GAST|nr:hypothetical protein RRG08_017058 [Elysia crispata]
MTRFPPLFSQIWTRASYRPVFHSRYTRNRRGKNAVALEKKRPSGWQQTVSWPEKAEKIKPAETMMEARRMCPQHKNIVLLSLFLLLVFLNPGEALERLLEAAYDEGHIISILPDPAFVSQHPDTRLDLSYPLLAKLNRSVSASSLSPPVSPPLRSLAWNDLIRPYPSRHIDIPVVRLSTIPRNVVDQGILYSADPNNKARQMEDRRSVWGYDEESRDSLGPSRWFLKFPACGRRFQSPIDIRLASVRYRPLSAIRIQPPNGRTSVELENLGATVSVTPKGREILFRGGNLRGSFRLYNIHFHWSNTDNAGSEHTQEGRGFSAEMHLVTYNTKYKNMSQAAGKSDGVHVIVVWLQRSTRLNGGLSLILNQLKRVRLPGSRVSIGMISIANLLPPSSVPYFRYRGSLTTPPCTGNIQFSVFSAALAISRRHLSQFRPVKLKTERNQFIMANSRSVQPLDSRVIFTNSLLYR